VVNTAQVRRGIIAGGDTSSGAAKALGICALTALAPTIPGAALLRAHRDDPRKAGLEIALKGGQMGAPNYFLQIKDGRSLA
jgi:3-oxoisoapionate kinase